MDKSDCILPTCASYLHVPIPHFIPKDWKNILLKINKGGSLN